MPNSTHGSVAYLTTIAALIIIGGYLFDNLPNILTNHSAEASAVVEENEERARERLTPTTAPQNKAVVETKPSLAVTVEVAKPDESEAIDNYIRTIFGKDAKVAIAVNRVECNPKNKQYPACVYHTEHEYSVGIFQINLYNAKHWIHAKKVPGETMEQKIEWLKNPYNNTLIAYKIFTDSGFEPWSGYTSGRYLDHMGN